MITKTYKAQSDVSFNIKIGSSTRRISFRPVSHGFSLYTTSNIKEQAGIENHAFFGSMFYLDKTVSTGEEEVEKKEVKVEEIVPEKELKGLPDIDNCPDAKNFLVSLGWEGKATSKESLRNIAKKYGYSFPNLN